MQRRTFLGTSLASAGSLAVLGCATRAVHAEDKPTTSGITLKPGDTVLFQGDSITDVRRNREKENEANAQSMLGGGYPKYLAWHLLSQYPQLNLKIFNRGISGNKVYQLQDRWQKDCLDLEPAVVSILIGVNDIWHKLNDKYDGTPETYREQYDRLLTTTREKLPGVQLVVCEPFVLRCGAVKDNWFPEFDERLAVAREISRKHGATLVGFQSMFDALVAQGSAPESWAKDGVHPQPDGHAMMAMRWIADCSVQAAG